jgi:hypothetical protein
MRARIELTQLEAIDSGEPVAEPHLWVVFFKIDGSTFSTVLAHKLARGKVKPEDLEHRGIRSVSKAGADRSSFAPLGFEGGAIQPMKTGDVRDVSASWQAELSGEGFLHDEDTAIGCFVVGWELDNERGGGNEAQYADFVADVRKRVFAEVSASADSQPLESGVYRLRLRTQPYLRQLDGHLDQTNEVAGVFAAQDHELALSKAYGGRFGGGVDTDDLLGTLVVVASHRTLGPGRHEGETLWVPTVASAEGTWKLRFAVTFGG